MKRYAPPIALAALTTALVACAPMQASEIAVHEVQIYGQNSQRLLWAYGDLAGETGKHIEVEGRDISLQASNAATGALLLEGKPFLNLPLEAAAFLPRAVLGADGRFDITGGADLSALYYWEGQQWFQLQATSGRNIAAVPVTGAAQTTLGDLTATESGQLFQALEGNRTLLLGVMSAGAEPTPRLSVQPQPADSRLTALVVTQPTLEQAVTTPPSSAQPIYREPVRQPTLAPQPPLNEGEEKGSNMQADIIAQGNNAGVTSATYKVANTRLQAQQIYNFAYGRQSPMPAPPELEGRTLVGLFLGQRMTGGYGLEVVSVSRAGDTATIKVRETRPSKGMLTTQALTSPWVIVALDGQFASVKVEGLSRSASPSRGNWQTQ